MRTEPQPPLLSEIADRAVEICDPAGHDAVCQQFLVEFEDADEPVSAIGDLDTRLADAAVAVDPKRDNPALTMVVAICSFLAPRAQELYSDREELLRLAARAEFEANPPEPVAAWLRSQGVSP